MQAGRIAFIMKTVAVMNLIRVNKTSIMDIGVLKPELLLKFFKSMIPI